MDDVRSGKVPPSKAVYPLPWKTRVVIWRRHRSNPCPDSAEKSPALQRTRLPSSTGVCSRRRNGLARRADIVHAAGALGAIPALSVAAQRGADELEQHWGSCAANTFSSVIPSLNL